MNMNLLSNLRVRIGAVWNKFLAFSRVKKGIAIVLILIVLFVGYRLTLGNKSTAPQYQTAQVTRGTLVVSLTEAGSVAVSNKVSVVTQASGIVSKVYVTSGEQVSAGEKIADVTLDTAGQQRQAQAYSSLLSAQNSLKNSQDDLYNLQNQLFVANQKFLNDKGISNPTDQDKQDPVYIEENDTWLAAEAAYKNQTNVIAQSQAGLNNASLGYQLTSGTIVAPTAGTIGDLTITPGMQIGSSNTTAGSSTNTSNQAIASIKTGNSTAVSVDVAEVDAPQVKVGQEATITFDALPDKSFTGKVMGINTTGSVSSGVTTYPAIIELDSTGADVFPNMSATASIITKVDDNVLLVPSAAVQTIGTTTSIRVLKNGQLTSVPVTVGDTSDSQTVITSGLSEGDTVVTSVVAPTTSSSSSTASPFGGGGLRIGGAGGGFSGGGGAAVRTGGGTGGGR